MQQEPSPRRRRRQRREEDAGAKAVGPQGLATGGFCNEQQEVALLKVGDAAERAEVQPSGGQQSLTGYQGKKAHPAN